MWKEQREGHREFLTWKLRSVSKRCNDREFSEQGHNLYKLFERFCMDDEAAEEEHKQRLYHDGVLELKESRWQ